MRMNVTGSVAHVRGSGTEAIGICGRSGAIVELFCMYGTISACTLSLGTKLYGVAPSGGSSARERSVALVSERILSIDDCNDGVTSNASGPQS